MKILVTGATGLIGASVCARLVSQGHQVIGVIRSGSVAAGNNPVLVMDVAKAVRPDDWMPHLAGIDAVVNCVGVLQDSALERTDAVHRDGPTALFLACERAGTRKLIHFSAIGVDRQQPSQFSISKYAGDQALMARDLDWVILRPSLVLGRPAFGASALIRGLAALPVVPSMPGTGLLQVIDLDDVVSTVTFFLDSASPSRLALDLAGPEQLTMDEIVGLYRQWFRWRPARRVILPEWAAALAYRAGDFAAGLGWRPAMRTNAAKEIRRGAVGDATAWTAITGITPKRLAATLAAEAVTVQEKWFAKLCFVKPVIFTILPFFWIMTGIISLSAGYTAGVALMQSAGAGVFSAPVVIAGALADMLIGASIAWRPTARKGLYGAIALSLFYALAATILRPDLWSEPLGPLMKIVPILVLHLVAAAILDER